MIEVDQEAQQNINYSPEIQTDEVGFSDGDPLFTNEEIDGVDLIVFGEDYIEVDCGCTNTRYGDSTGKLRIYRNGKLEILCDCYPGCGAKVSPSEFERHALLTGQSNWKLHVWVFVNGDKVPLRNTKLLKYYKGSASDPCSSIKPRRSRTVHRDEFLRCTSCGKERRFSRRNKDDCKAYHLAAANESWTCFDYPHAVFNCDDEEERVSKKRFSGCPQKPLCDGCTHCVCFGCSMCCFDDCSCRTCVDFIQNAEPK